MTKSYDKIGTILKEIDNRGYKAYHSLKGEYGHEFFTLFVDYVQGDPFAKPSRIRVRIENSVASFPHDTFYNRSRSVALRDFLARNFHYRAQSNSKGNRGSGNSGLIRIERPLQEILQRSSVVIKDGFIEVRFNVGLPAFGRRIAGGEAFEMFMHEIPEIVKKSLFFQSLDSQKLYKHLKISEDADYIRGELNSRDIVAFVADKSILPRRSGIDERPLNMGLVVPFVSPKRYEVSFNTPNSGVISGMGIPKGITLIVGGGYHGKSTLLNAIERGVYNHVPGDGREFVITGQNGVKVRASDGRSIEKVNISPFINNLPFGKNTEAFSTENASGSTSQAAAILEAVELGTDLLLIDEDTSATNFMIRDHRMQELISKKNEPITPFIDKAKQLYNDYNVSSILVIGGSGDYFSISDNIIGLKDYRPEDLTDKAHEISNRYRQERKDEGGENFGAVTERVPKPEGFDPRRGKKDVKISVNSISSITFGRETIEFQDIEQVVDSGQTKAIADSILYAKKYMYDNLSLREVAEKVLENIEKYGLDVLDPIPCGEYVLYRKQDFAAVINRLRTLKVKQR